MKYLIFIATLFLLSSYIFASESFIDKDTNKIDVITENNYNELNKNIDFEIHEDSFFTYWFSLSIIEKIFSTSIILFTGLAIIVLSL